MVVFGRLKNQTYSLTGFKLKNETCDWTLFGYIKFTFLLQCFSFWEQRRCKIENQEGLAILCCVSVVYNPWILQHVLGYIRVRCLEQRIICSDLKAKTHPLFVEVMIASTSWFVYGMLFMLRYGLVKYVHAAMHTQDEFVKHCWLDSK